MIKKIKKLKTKSFKIVFTILYIISLFSFLGNNFTMAASLNFVSNEISGTGLASRQAVDLLDDDWRNYLTTTYGACPTCFETGQILASDLPNVQFPTNGVTLGLSLRDMTNVLSPNDFGTAATTQGFAGSGSSTTMQDSSPKPDSLYNLGYAYYNETSGSNSSRNGLMIDFSTPIRAFGAWFGDLETRTDGQGTPALLRLYDSNGIQIGSDLMINPSTNAGFDQTQCGSPVNDSFAGCGNRTTRWIGFATDVLTPVSKMIVILGDDDTTNGSNDGFGEHLSIIGPTLVNTFDPPVPNIGIAKELSSQTAIDSNNQHFEFTGMVKNSGDIDATIDTITDNLQTVLGSDYSNASNIVVSSADFAVNANFDGSADTNVIGSSFVLAAHTSAEFTISFDLYFDQSSNYQNTLTVQASTLGGATVQDTSQNGSEVDPDQNNDSTDNNEPTPFQVTLVTNNSTTTTTNQTTPPTLVQAGSNPIKYFSLASIIFASIYLLQKHHQKNKSSLTSI